MGVKQKIYEDDFEILRRTYVIFNDLWGHNNVRIHRNFYQKEKSTIPESHSFRVFVRYRRTYVLNKGKKDIMKKKT